MLVIDKKKDFFTLLAMGIGPAKLGSIIRIAGGLVTFLGLIPGLIFGLLICMAQKRYGIVPLGMSSTIIHSYPIEIHGFDFFLVGLWVVLIGFVAIMNPARKAAGLTYSRG